MNDADSVSPPEHPAAGEHSTPAGNLRLAARAWRLAATYGVFALLWIYASDHVLGWIIPDLEMLVRLSVYKGFAFVAVTTALLYVLLRRNFGEVEVAYLALQDHEEEIERLSRLYVSLTHINQAIVRTPNREALFEKVCEVLVRDGGFALAWVGWEDAETKRLRPVAVVGDKDGFVDEIEIYTDDRPEGNGPSGQAFRSGRTYLCPDMLTDPSTRPWRRQIARSPFRSLAALPIRVDGRVAGLLNVYSPLVGGFRNQEVALLEEAAVDISFALDNFDREREHTEAEARAHSEQRFSSAMIESMPGVVYFYDMDGRFLRWNQNFEALTGFGAEDIARMTPLDFFSAEDRPLLQERIDEVFADGESSVEAPLQARDGTLRPLFFSGRRVEFEGRTCLVGVGIDISKRLKAEAALAALNQTLEHKVAERTEELKEALARAEAADQIKSAFLATMSHELRTPLNSIIGFTGIILQELAGPLNAEQAKQLGMVRSSARHLLELINDVLDISKIESGQLEVKREAFDLAASIERVVATVQPLAAKKNLDLQAVLPATMPRELVSDRRRCEQVLLNLLNNAIKFTDTGSVSLTVSILSRVAGDDLPPAGAAVQFQVADTGKGIREEDLPRLFQPFRQLDTGLSRQHEGTGLGLAICHRLVELMGGTIAVASAWQRGSTFTVTLPLAPAP